MTILVRPQTGFLPNGRWRIDRGHPLVSGMVYFRRLDHFGDPDLITTMGDDAGMVLLGTGANFNGNYGGVGLTGSTGTCYGRAARTQCDWAIPTTRGSCFMYVTASFAPTDGLEHYLLVAGKEGLAGGPYFDWTKFSDNNWYFGWVSALDHRAAGAATGSFNAGDSFVAGGTWSSAGTNFYTKGILRLTNGGAPSTGNTKQTAANFTQGIGGDGSGTTFQWIKTTQDAIYWCAFWDRELSQTEITLLSNDPYCFLIPSEYEMPVSFVSAAPSTIFRKTASRIGTRTGTRQTWAA